MFVSSVCVMVKLQMKIEEFWEEVGAVVGHSGKELAKFVLSLGTDYRKILINLRTSGTESRDEPMLRDSAELFVAFDEYYQLFHSQGGSIQPESSLAQPQSRYFQFVIGINHLYNVRNAVANHGE